MGSKVTDKLTYANVMATIAVFLALGGGAYAAVKINGKNIKPHSIPLNRIQGTLPPGKEGPRGAEGPKGAPGAPGEPGSAAAYAHVNANGTLDAPNSKNLESEQTVQPGYYCIKSSVPVHNIVVSPDINGAIETVTGSFEDPFTSCPSGDVVVSTWNYKDEYASLPFYIEIN